MTLGEIFMRRLIDCMPSPEARMVCVMELGRWQGKTLYIPTEKRGERRRKAALNMLDQGKSPADAALIIHERYGVSLRQAQRDIKHCQMSRAGVAVES